MAQKNQKQITLHFTQDNAYILDDAKRNAKESFRTTEQQLIYMLSMCVEKPKVAVPAVVVPAVVPAVVTAAGTDGLGTTTEPQEA